MTRQIELPTSVELRFDPHPDSETIWMNYEDVSNDRAWYKLNQGSPYLTSNDFKSESVFQKYWYLSAGLTVATVFVYGDEGGGKSLFCNHTAYHQRILFDRKCTLNWRPKQGFGDYDYIDNEMLVEELNNMRDLTHMQNDLGEDEEISDKIKEDLKKSKLYRRIFWIDESYEDVDKSHRTNVTRNYGRLVRQRRHLHSLIGFISPDKEDFDRRLLWKRRTHEVSCSEGKILDGYCSMIVWWKKKGITKQMHLKPENWVWLWDSYNLAMGGSVLQVKN